MYVAHFIMIMCIVCTHGTLVDWTGPTATQHTSDRLQERVGEVLREGSGGLCHSPTVSPLAPNN